MKVFVTGGTGLVGHSVIPALVSAGHTVTALGRSDESEEKLLKLGAQTTVRGDLGSLQVMSDECSRADAAIHLAFDHHLAFTGKGAEALEGDRKAISAMADALVATSPSKDTGKEKVFINTAGLLDQGGPDEKSPKHKSEQMPRHLSEELTLSYADKGIRAIVVRLPPVVHGHGFEHPFITAQIGAAKKSGHAVYVNEGSNLWPACNVADAAQLYVKALERAPSGVAVHAVGEEGIPTKEIASFIARKLNVPTKSIEPAQAMQDLGFIGWVLQAGQRTTAGYTKEWTGWSPTHSGLFDTIGNYQY